MQVDSYKNHLKNLEQVKSELKIERPWTPSFSLSKMQNKYRKCTVATT